METNSNQQPTQQPIKADKPVIDKGKLEQQKAVKQQQVKNDETVKK